VAGPRTVSAVTAVGAQRRPSSARWWAAFALAGLAGVALRVWTYRSTIGIPDSDEALVGLMVRHIIHGELPTFYYGQAFGGTQEDFLTVPGFVVFGSSWLALRIVPIALSAVAALLVWRVGRRTIGEPAAGIAGALFWIWPPFIIYKLTHQYGFYASDVVYSGLLLLLSLRIVEQPDRRRVGLFGLVFGLAVWQTIQIVPVAVPIVAWTVWKQPRALRQIWVAVPLALLGALPWIVWNLRHDWGSLSIPVDASTTYAHRLRLFFSPIVPMMLGLRAPFSQVGLLPGVLTTLVWAVLIGLFAFGAYRTRWRNVSLLYVVAAVFPFIYAINHLTFISYHPGYTVVLSPVLALLLAQLATNYWKGIVVLALALAVSVVTLHRMNTYNPGAANQPTKAPRQLAPLISTLDRLGIDRVYADYWLAYVLAFDSKERILAAQNEFRDVTFRNGIATPSDDLVPRIPAYERKVKASPRTAFVFFRQGLSSVPIVHRLEQHGYRRTVVGPFAVYSPG
jgi:hypothetical protein